MLRSIFSRLMVVALLVMSMEGTIDSVFAAEKLHIDSFEHHLDSAEQHQANADHGGSGEQSNDHCENCCHGHTSCLSAVTIMVTDSDANAALSYKHPQFHYFALAPPTPPPNA